MNNLLVILICAFCLGENVTLFIVRCCDGQFTAGLALTLGACATIACVIGGRAMARYFE